MKQQRRTERPEVRQALALMRQSVGFILIVDVPHPNRDAVESAFRRGEPPPTNLRLFASALFQPPSKTAATLAVMARSLYARLDGGQQGPVPGLPLEFKGQLVTKPNGKIELGPRHLHHIAFGAEGDYGEQLHMLAIDEEVPPGADPGSGVDNVMWSAVYPAGADHAKAHFAALDEWARAQLGELARATQWARGEVEELVGAAVLQLRKAWQGEANANAREDT